MTSTRRFVAGDDVADLVRAHLGSDRRVVDIERCTGGSKKGVYRLTLDDAATIALHVWHLDENFWPVAPSPDPDDPFVDATGIGLFEAAYQRLVAIGVGTPVVHVIDRSHSLYPADLALVEDVRRGKLEELIERDRAAAERPIAMLREALTAMRHDVSTSFGKVAVVEAGHGVTDRSAPEVILRRALGHLAEAAGYEPRIDAARAAIGAKLRELADAVRPRSGYGLIHGELGADHVLLDATGAPLLIDIEGLAYFDIEWEHVFLKIRFGETIRPLRRTTSILTACAFTSSRTTCRWWPARCGSRPSVTSTTPRSCGRSPTRTPVACSLTSPEAFIASLRWCFGYTLMSAIR